MAKKFEEAVRDKTGETVEIKAFSFDESLPKYLELVAYFRWYPDLFLDLLKPKTGGINLTLDQRVFMRAQVRFNSMYGVVSRSWGKTFLEVAVMVVTAILYPNCMQSLTAQTKQNAAKLLKDKWKELIRYYPLLKNELSAEPKFSKDEVEILFRNGSVIDVLANAQTSKGQRRNKINIEESALLDASLFDDALAPIVDNPRRTSGRYSIINPQEIHRQISFFTTAWYRASFEYTRFVQMTREMAECKGVFVFSAGWQLGAWYGRGADKTKIKSIRTKTNPVMFDMNYESKWVGATEGAVVNIQQLMGLRTLENAMLSNTDGGEYYMGVDVARSDDAGSSSNAQTAITIGRVLRRDNNTIQRVQVPFITTVAGSKMMSVQAHRIKELFALFKCRALIIDSNGLGKGLTDELLKDDPEYGAYCTMNSDVDGQDLNAPKVIYDLKVTGSDSFNSDIIVNFIGCVQNEILELLVPKNATSLSVDDLNMSDVDKLPFIHTEFLIQEIANLQLETKSNNRVAIKRIVARLGKDRFSALEYLLWYISTFEKGVQVKDDGGEALMGFAQFF